MLKRLTSIALLLALLAPAVFALPLPLQDVGSLARRAQEGEEVTGLWWKILIIIILLIIDGLVAGLILGLMSLDETDLRILKASGSPSEKRCAEKVEPVRRQGHLLLVTLLLVNSVINEALPILLDPISGGGIQAVAISTVAILIFAEIIPQSVCSRYGLQVGAFFAWPVRIMIGVFYVVAKPIAMLLDYLLGAGHGMMYKKSQLKELVGLHATEHGGDLTHDEITILQGTLNVHQQKVQDVMTPLERVYMLPSTAKLNRATMQEILRLGHSRIPVYSGTKSNILGILLVKTLILLDPDAETPVSQVRLITKVPKANPDTNLFHMLNIFQEGASHLATVHDKVDLIGIITIEDVIEEIIQEESRFPALYDALLSDPLTFCFAVIDETDLFTNNENTSDQNRVARPPLSNRPTFSGLLNVRRPASGGPKSPEAIVKKEKKFRERAAHRSASQATGDSPMLVVPSVAITPGRAASMPGPAQQTTASSSPLSASPVLGGMRGFQEPDSVSVFGDTHHHFSGDPVRNEEKVVDLAVSTGQAAHDPGEDHAPPDSNNFEASTTKLL
ncbi:hypothetical protein HDU86_007425 [Geranomyces michiganensis]|nr:hypothetical protein HDU86_007425 [Geranomyces michiganensis]